ncbi:unnamed protein product [Coregonus sp. 'balchen']|nr:unnamed protein product [Coregonus sp. 'balchen']
MVPVQLENPVPHLLSLSLSVSLCPPFSPSFSLPLSLSLRLSLFPACLEFLREEGTMVTPLTQQCFNLVEMENSVLYCICGVEVITGFQFVRWLSRRTAVRVVLAMGLILCKISCVRCLIFLANPQGEFWDPFITVAQVSLFSKVTTEKTQGFSQGVRRSVVGLATILGPLWERGLTGNLYVMLGVMMALLALLTIMMFFSYDRLVEPSVVEHAESSEDCGER